MTDPTELDIEELRVAVYQWFSETGRAPTTEALASRVGSDVEQVEVGLQVLGTSRHLALDDRGAIVMAHPFSAVPLGFSVMSGGRLYWGGCAWDSFAMPGFVPDSREVLVATTCPGCGSAHAWMVGLEAPPPGNQVAHFLVPANRMWDDVVHTCGHQRIFCNRECVQGWLLSSGYREGSILDLATLWRLARHWYDGRLERGYTRREPAKATEYFREAGLQGDFWGL